MRLLSFRTAAGASFGAVKGDGIVDLGRRLGDGGRTLRGWLERSAGTADVAGLEAIVARSDTDLPLKDVRYLPTVPNPQKIICIGVNYGDRNAEYREQKSQAKYPSVFLRTRESLVGHREPILRPPESGQLDYEGEIVLVIGKPGRRIPRDRVWDHIAGFTLMNEGSVRDWLRHARFNVTQGKNFERSGSLGPWMVTAEVLKGRDALHLTTTVNGEIRQDDTTANLLFPFDYLVSYLSTFMRLQPGDVIATGTPTGAGARFDPPKYLKPGDVVKVAVPEIGTLVNAVRDEE
ncbi:MAG: fumarylacetoacetate hydrolase family protein [Rhodospirillaceae bacterium]|nr:fumarylacetoacetate hydrolase family protein [Rhodospirillaceae bacterium]